MGSDSDKDQHSDDPNELADEIQRSATKLEELEREIEEIGEPASGELRHRLEQLKIEERALQRNFGELDPQSEASSARLAKIERLLHHIESVEQSLQHDADFLHQGNPTSLEAAIRSGSKIVNESADKLKRAVDGRLGDHHVLPPRSPFVNRTHQGLAERYHLEDKDKDKAKGKGQGNAGHD